MLCHQSLRASRRSATLMIKVKAVSSSIYKPCLVNRYKLWRNDFCGPLGEPSYLCLVWSILFEENQYIVHPPPATKKKLCSAEFIKGCLRGRFLKSGRRGNNEKRSRNIQLFSLVKSARKANRWRPRKAKRCHFISIIVLSGCASLYRKRYVERP